jgi:hypothetical protein
MPRQKFCRGIFINKNRWLLIFAGGGQPSAAVLP